MVDSPNDALRPHKVSGQKSPRGRVGEQKKKIAQKLQKNREKNREKNAIKNSDSRKINNQLGPSMKSW